MIGLLRRFVRWFDERDARRGMEYVTQMGWVSMEGMVMLTPEEWKELGYPPRMTHHPNYVIRADQIMVAVSVWHAACEARADRLEREAGA